MCARDRDQEKRRRRQKRQDHKRRGQQAAAWRAPKDTSDALSQLHAVMRNLEAALKVPPPAYWPGASEPGLERPDQVKFELAEFATKKEPGRSKCRLLERGFQNGPLRILPNLDHWAWEEFLWHGLPGDPWHPVEAFLKQTGDRFSPAGQAQLRLWKQARIGLFQVGEVHDETIDLAEWDPLARRVSGPPLRAITLNIGGVHVYRGAQGSILLTYLAPWVPDDNLFCATGYGRNVAPDKVGVECMYLGLAHPEVTGRPLPWKMNRRTADEWLRQWRTREWYGWLSERLQFPFPAVVAMPPPQIPELKIVRRLLPSSVEHARLFGIYLEVDLKEGQIMGAGATTLQPLDVTSPNFAALIEYQGYRDLVGPPPGVRGQPDVLRFR